MEVGFESWSNAQLCLLYPWVSLRKWRVTQGASWDPSLDFQNQHPCGGGGRNPCAGDCSRTSQCCLFVAPPYFQPSTKPSLLLLPLREPFSPLHLGCILALSPRSWADLGGWLSSAPQIPHGETTEAEGAGVLLLHSPILSVGRLNPLPGWPPVGAGGPVGEGKAGRVREESMVAIQASGLGSPGSNPSSAISLLNGD